MLWLLLFLHYSKYSLDTKLPLIKLLLKYCIKNVARYSQPPFVYFNDLGLTKGNTYQTT